MMPNNAVFSADYCRADGHNRGQHNIQQWWTKLSHHSTIFSAAALPWSFQSALSRSLSVRNRSISAYESNEGSAALDQCEHTGHTKPAHLYQGGPVCLSLLLLWKDIWHVSHSTFTRKWHTTTRSWEEHERSCHTLSTDMKYYCILDLSQLGGRQKVAHQQGLYHTNRRLCDLL